MDTKLREKEIIKTSIVGIIVNLVLVAFKIIIGFLTNSIAIILDGINNLTDALSSVITIIGAKLSGKRPDKKHPMGYGRIEYFSSIIIAALVIYAGVTAAIESIKKIIHPEAADYSVVSLIIIAVAIAAKLLLGTFVEKKGKLLESTALEASGKDSKNDAILSASVLLSALIFFFTGFSIEAYVGIIISAIILKAGVEILLETADDLLGRRADADLSKKIKSIVRETPGVNGAYDLFFNDYGPNKTNASVHIELDDTITIAEADVICRKVQKNVYEQTNIMLVAIGIYSHNTNNDEKAKMRNEIAKKVTAYDWALQIHGFYVDDETNSIRFDTVIDFKIDPAFAKETIIKEVKALYPGYDIEISLDIDISD